MRIALVSLHTDPYALLGSGEAGGMNVVVSAVASRLAALGHEVDVLTRRDDAAAPRERRIGPGLMLRLLPAGPTAPLPKHEIDQYCDEFSAAFAQLDTYDVVHSHHWMSGVATLPVARRWGVPHVMSYHSVAAPEGSQLSAGEPTESPARVPAEAMLARESDLVIAVSQAEAEMIMALGAPRNHVAVVRPGVDCDTFRPLRSGESAWLPDPYVLMAARLQPLKGPDLAVETLHAVPPELRPLLVIAGGASSNHADYVADLERLIANANLGAHVLHVGSQERDLFATMMRGAQVVVVPSHIETFGLVALEAAASGVPVIASAAGGLTEAVVDGQTGTLMTSRDPRRWAVALTRYLGDPDLRTRTGAAARRRAESMTWDATAEALSVWYAVVRR